ncbi:MULTISPECIES: primosomal protein N' [unclassified Leptolyngbya]|uniref:primosomal protein N' n=1 Tax=unclassified Leptolyngbya TaxID=2650499 RepID=UPI001686FB93|nr:MULTISPECIES: primosomal protein N' [unclassified Leptolyngbya]MBD1910319.1 primosomal protein N' [Leptolyngbya sp. FACHB-8]MBD2154878.1 primosomal protein N' [Leptolyngbya sp. FACHB-16]
MVLSDLTVASEGGLQVGETPNAYGEAQQLWVDVLVDCPGALESYLYRIPSGLMVEPGDIVSVPFGAQQMGGLALRRVTQLPDDLDTTQIRAVEEVVGRGFFPAGYWSLLQRVADYYCAPLMQVVRTALPPGLLRRSQRRIRLIAPRDAVLSTQTPAAHRLITLLQSTPTADYTWHYLQRQVPRANQGLRELLALGWVESYLEPPKPVRPKQRQAVTLTDEGRTDLSTRQREVLEVLRRQGGELWLQDLLQLCRASSSVVKSLEQKGCVIVQSREVLRRELDGSVQADQAQTLTPDQAEAVAAILAETNQPKDQSGQTILLHGVTGSGKTEVYLQAIAPLLQQGKSVLVLVPEIGLTPQLTDRFRARFGKRVLLYHSALSDGERYDTWRQMLMPEPHVVIGTRSAIFAPLHHLSLIVLDEEHDTSFKQDSPAPCYHARTVAQWRAKQVGCPLILGSATPDLETWQEAIASTSVTHPTTQPNIRYLTLPHRIQARPLPPIQVVDMRQELFQGNRSIFSRSLQNALGTLRERGQQGLLFIHRRGHSTFVSCRACGHVLNCPHCDISLTYHQPNPDYAPLLRCHYCNHTSSHPSLCPACDSPYLKQFGSGTQRVVEELSRQFPDLRCIRFDSDTTRAKGAHRALLTRFAQGEADLLVGTQMLTKGIDLPLVTLVGVVAADGLLHLADYRAGERAFQVLVQVAGRAGRGEEQGQVFLQTYSPEHPVIQAVQKQQYEPFAEEELSFRSTLRYPPYCRLVLLRLSGTEEDVVRRTASEIAQHLRSLAPEWELLGPAPAAIARVARRYRWQILLKGAIEAVPNAIDWSSIRIACPRSVSLTVDVDPLNLG